MLFFFFFFVFSPALISRQRLKAIYEKRCYSETIISIVLVQAALVKLVAFIIYCILLKTYYEFRV